VYFNSGTFTMSGGEISGNTASSSGGGVYAQYATFIKTGGTIYGDTDAVAGNGNVNDNTALSGIGHAVGLNYNVYIDTKFRNSTAGPEVLLYSEYETGTGNRTFSDPATGDTTANWEGMTPDA
jgi:predicted outer membrane repeat protein